MLPLWIRWKIIEHLLTHVNISNKHIFSNHHDQEEPITIGPPLPSPCPHGYELNHSNQCICVVNGKYAYQYENIDSVINQYECREQCEDRFDCQYYEFNNSNKQCEVWNLNEAVNYNPSVLRSHWSTNCSTPEGNFHNIAFVYNKPHISF